MVQVVIALVPLLLITLTTNALAAASPFAPGPYAVGTVTVGTQKAPNPELPDGTALTVYAPVGIQSATASWPVLSFVTGFGGIMSVSAYSEFLQAVAARGVVVVGVDHKMSGMPDYPKLGQDLATTLAWLQASGHLDAALAPLANGTSPAPRADVANRLVVGAQSAGNHVTVQMLEHLGCGAAKGLFMLDPVDGYDPFGIMKGKNVIKGGAAVNFTLPALHVETGMDPLKANFLFPPCAPAELSNDHFYDAFRSGPIWQVNATAFGHLDCTDSGAVSGMKIMCPGNKGGASARTQYHTLLSGLVGAFVEGLFADDAGAAAESFAVLSDGAAMPVTTLLQHNYNGVAPAAFKGGCTHKKMPTTAAH